VKNFFSPLDEMVRDDNFEGFKEICDKILEGEEEPIPSDDRVDWLGFTLIHHLCLGRNTKFLDLMFEYWDTNKDKCKLLFDNDINDEMNRYHKMSGLTPISSILFNGTNEMVEYIFSKIFTDRYLLFNISARDCRNRNIIHGILTNTNLTVQDKFKIFTQYFNLISKEIMYNEECTIEELYNEVDKDGFLPLTTFILQLSPGTQSDPTNVLMLEHLLKQTHKEVYSDPKLPNLVHPLLPCIQLNLDELFKKLQELQPELKKTCGPMRLCNGRSTLEFAFNTLNPFYISALIEQLEFLDEEVPPGNFIFNLSVL
jgi:hypothetical protein